MELEQTVDATRRSDDDIRNKLNTMDGKRTKRKSHVKRKIRHNTHYYNTFVHVIQTYYIHYTTSLHGDLRYHIRLRSRRFCSRVKLIRFFVNIYII